MIRSFFSCIKSIAGDSEVLQDAYEDLKDRLSVLDKAELVSDKGDALEDMLKRNLITIKGRRKRMRDIPIKILPTRFDDDDEPPEEDEDGDETLAVRDGLFCNQDYTRLHARCTESATKFVDPEFPPCDAALFLDGDTDDTIEWKRPSEIQDTPGFFVEGASRFDVKQGELGDCWLLAAIANLTMNKKLFEKVVPSNQDFTENYSGVFHFRFWQYGEWVDVVVDDLLPTRNGRLIYMRSETKNEFWSALLEKAYAKLHGCYEALKGGTTSEAMVDFSGGCSEQFSLNEDAPPDLFSIMLKSYQRASMEACSLEPDPSEFEAKTRTGLVRGHAYSITKVVKAQVDTGSRRGLFPLIRIRNPWGDDTEWKGSWSDGSPEWSFIPDDEKENLGLNFDADGEFYMSLKDYLSNFDTLEMCNLGPDSVDDDDLAAGKMEWHQKQFNGSWIAGQTAGGCRNFLDTFALNPQFKVVLTDSDDDEDDLCTCVISLMQKGSRKRKAANRGGCLTIGFSIYRLDEPDTVCMPLDTDFFRYHASAARPKSFINLRELTARFKLAPGTYVVIPSTFQADEEGDFLLRVFSEKDSSVEAVNDIGEEE